MAFVAQRRDGRSKIPLESSVRVDGCRLSTGRGGAGGVPGPGLALLIVRERIDPRGDRTGAAGASK